MAGKWTDSPGNGVYVGFFYDSLEMDTAGKKARIKGGRIRIRRKVNISDSSNSLTWSGDLITDGSQNNINVSGSGDKTIKTVTGSWVTLSTTKAVTASGTIILSGVNYAGKTLKVTVTVTFPLAGDGGTVSPIPTPGGDAYPNPWEDDDAPDFATEPYVEHVWTVRLPGAPAQLRTVPAWDIQVDLDGGRAPYGTARFKAPVAYLDEAAYPYSNPRGVPVVQIDAGWRYPGSLNVHTLFSGVITERALRIDDTGAYCEFTAESYESILEYPSHLTKAVDNGWTSVKQLYDSTAFYRRPAWVEPASNTAPDSAALAEYRALGIETDDDVGDWLRTAASTLGQWMRGHLAAATPTIECITDPYPYQRLVQLDVNAFSDIERVENLDQWANIVRLTAQWTYNSDGDTKQKRRTYYAAGATSGTGAIRARDVVLNVKPPGGNNPPANWSPALRWVRRFNEASRGTWSGSCRALWWLQPRLDGVMLARAPLADTAGQVQQVTFLVDQGLMTIRWNVVHP
ncbi:MAG: hypothetical protein QM582_14080 [Micropruina sp.]|uniref:hypothetical protein n=1 Tax=Micropruina sp. TaxID=2737536 RepID=UPI0039E4971D